MKSLELYFHSKIVLDGCCCPKHKQYDYQPLIPPPYTVASQAARDAYNALYDVQNEVACLMLGSMSPELQRTLENYKAYDIIQELKTMFEEQAKQELFETVKAFHACKQEEGQSVSSYLLKMKRYLDTREHLGYAMPNELGVSLILNSLNKDYDQFLQNYNMHSMGKMIAELHAMLKLHKKGRMILNSIQNGPLIWPTITEEDGTTRTKKYEELSATKKIQNDCDCKATNIVLQGIPPDVYAIINHHKFAKEIWDRVKLLMQGTKLSLQEKECLAVLVFNQGDDPIACLNKAMAFLTAVASSRFPSTNNQLRTSNPRNQATIQDGRVTVQQVQGRQGQSYAGNSYKGNATSSGGNNTGGQARVIKCYNCQGEGHMARQCTQPKRPRNAAWFKENAMLAEAQEAGKFLDEEKLAFISDLRIPDSQAVQTTIPNNAAFQTEDLDAYDSDCDDVSNAKSVTAELERYKERVKTFEQRLNIDLSTREKMIDSQMDDMIKVKLALKKKIDTLKQNLSNQIKEKESLLQTFTVFKEKENKYMENEIDLEKKIKELDNIVYKVGQSAQTKAQRIKPTLYDGSVIFDKHVASPVFDDEETLILEEVSRSKMLAKQNDPILKEKKVNTTPINYAELNRLFEDFGKRFVPQQELSDEQAFWLQTSHPNTDQSALSPVKIEAPRELPKVSLVNTSLKNLKYHLGKFEVVVKKWITPDAITEGELGYEHTKTIFLDEIIPFLKTLKDIFNVFDKDVLNEVTEVQTVFNQKEAAVQQYFVDKKCFEIQKKDFFLENDRLL
ncbi:integrase, catalytic region, zinc finger, CCHC-type containing protein [Tanacetum coccineum]|uniref:Integrase, catalytic region, zinc finger, CCHC-type containing protein n=1 Tax=Tanacetum coccineum TaxID=301880 RepID=A0ABQ4Z1S1_9ASTR